MLQEFLAHADTGIADRPAVSTYTVFFIYHIHNGRYFAIGAIILNTVPVNIQENLTQVYRTSVNIRIWNNGFPFFIIPDNPRLYRPASNDRPNILCQCNQADYLMGQNGSSVLQLAHFQHIIDQ